MEIARTEDEVIIEADESVWMRRDQRACGLDGRADCRVSVTDVCAGGFDADQVALVRDDPDARLGLLRRLYEPPPDRSARHLPYRRAALAFMGWQLRRGLLNPLTSPAPGSPWWRAVNERLLLDTCEARVRTFGDGDEPSTHSARLSVEFARRPSARTASSRAPPARPGRYVVRMLRHAPGCGQG